MRSLLHLLRPRLRTSLPTTRPVTLPLTRRRSFTRTLVTPFTRTISTPSTAGYGDADQTGESAHPERAGQRPRIDTEHPGREPVDEGKGTGSGGEAETGSSKHSANKSGNWYGEETSDGPGSVQGVSSGGKRDVHGGTGGKSVHDAMDTAEGHSSDVERHNREMDNRYDRRKGGQGDEKVGKGFWTGE